MLVRWVGGAALLAMISAIPAQGASAPRRGEKLDLLQCRIGASERLQTRLAMQITKNKPVYVAFWNSNGPYRCSFEARRSGDGFTRWSETNVGTLVTLIKGTVLIRHVGKDFEVTMRDVDRMTYCGQFGKLSGTFTVPANKSECTWQEITSEEAGDLNQPAPAPAPSPQSEASPRETVAELAPAVLDDRGE